MALPGVWCVVVDREIISGLPDDAVADCLGAKHREGVRIGQC